jgi:CheY-like chemotaxis protein
MRVLIVDDSLVCRAQARHAVEAAGPSLGRGRSGATADELAIAEAASGADALREMVTAPVDLLVVDLHLPVVNGLELLSFWGKRTVEGNRAVVVSTDVSAVDRERARSFGSVAFCDKPVTPESLLAALASLSD